MEPARQDPGPHQNAGSGRNPAPRREWDDPLAGPKSRRVEEPPALAMVAAPVVGLLIWAGLIALVF